jgi:hypothetical protein
MEVGLELAGVQMPPGSFIGVIPTGQFLPAFRTGPLRPGRMLKPYIHTGFGNLQIRPFYKPRLFQTQNALVTVGVPVVTLERYNRFVPNLTREDGKALLAAGLTGERFPVRNRIN